MHRILHFFWFASAHKIQKYIKKQVLLLLGFSPHGRNTDVCETAGTNRFCITEYRESIRDRYITNPKLYFESFLSGWALVRIGLLLFSHLVHPVWTIDSKRSSGYRNQVFHPSSVIREPFWLFWYQSTWQCVQWAGLSGWSILVHIKLWCWLDASGWGAGLA